MQHRPKRSLGQNFLRDRNVIERIVAALDLRPEDHVIEIGPGQGALTQLLLKAGAHVTAIEFDRDLAPALGQRFASADKLTVLEADVLEVDLTAIARANTKLVANLPYNISTPILQRLIEQRAAFSTLVLMFQKEVAERITATPRGKERGFLSVLAQSSFDIEYLFDVPRTAFYPVPKVWSAVVRLVPKPVLPNEASLRELISLGFMQRRKTLVNNLSRRYPGITDALEELGASLKCRAEELSVGEWQALSRNLEKV